MSVFLVDLVLKAKMPIDMQSRAAKKLVLVSLAKHCHNDGGFECRPSRKTMAIAAERTERTIDAFLVDLAARGFITKTDKARKHRAVEWRLDVDRLVDLQHVASLDPSQDLQPVASLPTSTRLTDGVLDRQFQPVDLQLQNQDLQFQRIDLQPVATERSERSERNEQIPGANAPIVSLQQDEGRQEQYDVTKRIVHEAIDKLGTMAAFADISDDVKQRLADAHIPYNGPLVAGVLTIALASRQQHKHRARATA